MPKPGLKQIIDAAVSNGPRVVRGSEGTGAVRHRERRQPSLKDWLLSPKGGTENLLAGGGKDIEISPAETD